MNGVIPGLALALGLVAYSQVTNLRLGDRGYVRRNLLAVVVLLALARAAGLDREALGIDVAGLSTGLYWGLLAVVAITLAVAVAWAAARVSAAVARLLADRRADLPGRALAFHALVRIPVGTALFEEVAFRGVLFAVLLDASSTPIAVAVASVAFGLWHVAPTIETLRSNDVSRRAGPIAGAVALTTVAGVGFCILRLASGGLLAPVMAHWAVNALFLLLAAAVHRGAHEGEPR